MEVAMRPPEVFVRELSSAQGDYECPEEGARLKSISKKARYESKRQRAIIVLASATGMSAPQIAAMARTDESHVRKVLHSSNDRGFASLDPDYRGGRPKKTTPEQRDRIVAVARARPDTQGVALTRWSLAKLSEHLAGLGIVLCEEALRQTLRAAGLSHQRTRSWKWSPDPDFAPKAERVLSLYRAKPDDGVVVCFDEMGPIQLIPHPGSGWATAKRPERMRATYSKHNGVRYLFGAYDVHADRLHGRLRAHKNAGEVLAFYEQIRMRYDPKRRAVVSIAAGLCPLAARSERPHPQGRRSQVRILSGALRLSAFCVSVQSVWGDIRTCHRRGWSGGRRAVRLRLSECTLGGRARRRSDRGPSRSLPHAGSRRGTRRSPSFARMAQERPTHPDAKGRHWRPVTVADDASLGASVPAVKRRLIRAIRAVQGRLVALAQQRSAPPYPRPLVPASRHARKSRPTSRQTRCVSRA
jgi:transposase